MQRVRDWGKHWFMHFSKELSVRGLKCVDLTTDRDNNEQVNNFYRKLGFVCDRTFTTPEGRAMNEYVFNLNNLYLSDPLLD